MRNMVDLGTEKAWFQCERKRRYEGYKHARREARKIAERFGKPVMREYYCEYCWGWHLTKKEK